MVEFFFFFSSRRRHTRCSRDWSSDVCSSDLIGVEGNDTPHTFVITIDGEEVFSTTIGGPQDHEEQGKSLTETQPILDARMTTRVKVTAGPHNVGFTRSEERRVGKGCRSTGVR